MGGLEKILLSILSLLFSIKIFQSGKIFSVLIIISFISCKNNLTNVEQPIDDFSLKGSVSVSTGANTFSYRNYASIVPIEIINNTNQKIYIPNDRFGIQLIVEQFQSDHWVDIHYGSNDKSELLLNEGKSYRDSVDLYWDAGKYRVKIPFKYQNGIHDTLVTEPIYVLALGERYLKADLAQDSSNGKLLLKLKNISSSKITFYYGLHPYCHFTIGLFKKVTNNGLVPLYWSDSKLRWIEKLDQNVFDVCLASPPERVLLPKESFSGYVSDIFPEGEIKCFMRISVEGSIYNYETIIKTFNYKVFERK